MPLWLKPFSIIATCPTGGLIETIPDAVSINQLKKQNPSITTLRQFFIKNFKTHGVQKGSKKHKRYQAAKQNFMKSMAGYSLLCYIL